MWTFFDMNDDEPHGTILKGAVRRLRDRVVLFETYGRASSTRVRVR